MIKGHTKIELFNAETGKIEKTYEKDNLVTNAVQYLIAAQNMMGKVMNQSVFPIATNALGGLMLFNNTLDEDADNVAYPSNAKLVGYGDRASNTTDPMRGSLNSIESHATDTGYVSVWDFGTAQGNGTIKAIALTNKYAGANPFQRQFYLDSVCDTNVNDSLEHDARVLFVKDEEVYWLRRDGKTIQKCRLDLYQAKVNDLSYNDLAETAIDVTTLDPPSHEGLQVSNPYQYWLPGYDGYIYFITQNNRVNTYTYYGNTYHDYHFDEKNDTGDAKIYVTKYKYSDLSFKADAEQEITLAGVHLTNRHEGSMLVRNNHLYARGSDEKSIYVIDLANIADIKIFKTQNDGTIQNMCPLLYNGGIQYQYDYKVDGTTYTKVGFLYEDGTYSEEATTGAPVANPCIAFLDDKVLATYHYDGYYDNDRIRTVFRAAYLGTINNLSSPITKNASQTMKVTYTLTDKEDSDETV
jgi:hypothetical protein